MHSRKTKRIDADAGENGAVVRQPLLEVSDAGDDGLFIYLGKIKANFVDLRPALATSATGRVWLGCTCFGRLRPYPCPFVWGCRSGGACACAAWRNSPPQPPYLCSLAGTPVPCRERACARLFAPVGLDLGGDGAEAIALSITAEVQACIQGKLGHSRRLTPAMVDEQIEIGGASRYLQAQCAL